MIKARQYRQVKHLWHWLVKCGNRTELCYMVWTLINCSWIRIIEVSEIISIILKHHGCHRTSYSGLHHFCIYFVSLYWYRSVPLCNRRQAEIHWRIFAWKQETGFNSSHYISNGFLYFHKLLVGISSRNVCIWNSVLVRMFRAVTGSILRLCAFCASLVSTKIDQCKWGR